MSKIEHQQKESDFKTACQWWSDQPNIFTHVGWKDHMFRFNVFWEGTLVARPNNNTRTDILTDTWKDNDAQFGFNPNGIGRSPGGLSDDGMTDQGWNACPAPVLWSQWPTIDGILYRQEVFAHVPGGQAVQRGDEPLFAWIRLTFADLFETLPLEKEGKYDITIQSHHIRQGMRSRSTYLLPNQAMYPRALAMEGQAPGAVRIVEPDGRIRLGVAANAQCRARFVSPYRNHSAYHLWLEGLKVKKGTSVDLLLPMIPADRETFDRELELGYDAALREANKFWSLQPAKRASMRVPEAAVNEAIRHNERLSYSLTEKYPVTGKYCKITGSLAYGNLWPTPCAMELIMIMDTLGLHEYVGRYLEIFLEEQGSVVPPGDAYKSHPGYLCTPTIYKSADWLSDNGALLYALSMHGLLSGDKAYIARFTEAIVKSCDWIKTHRAMKGHGGCEGVLPAAKSTDSPRIYQAVWSDGWNYKGLVTAVRLLKKIGHPRAAEFEKEAKDYQSAFLRALRDKCRHMPQWTDAKGRKQILVPMALSGDNHRDMREAIYLDSGPLFLVFAELMDAGDPLMRGVTQWFREGPQWKHYHHDGNCFQISVLDHEMSSCEPYYSWNVFHSWQLGDREKFLEGMYSLFAGAMSRKTYVTSESRGGIYGLSPLPLPVYMARLAVVDDQIKPDELHLLRLMPLAWLKTGDESVFEKMPTEFGPVTLQTRMSSNGKTLEVIFKPAFREGEAPKKIVLHVPPVMRLEKIIINNRKCGVSPKQIVLSAKEL